VAAPGPLTQITTGWSHACALDDAGAAYCWGDNTSGELGDGSTVTQAGTPVAVDTSGVLAGVSLSQISAGMQQTCAVSTTGTGYCWGLNNEGQLGDNTTTNSGVPVQVLPVTDATQTSVSCSPDPVAAGTASTCTATVTDTAACTVTPTGTVSFSSTGPGSFSGGGSCTLTGSGASTSCQLTYTQAASGEPTITGTYGGDGQHLPSTGTAAMTVYQPLNGNSTCTGMDGGTGQNLTVPTGASCTLIAGTVVTGNITDNGTLTASGVTIDGNLQTRNAGPLTLIGSSTTIGGNLQVQGGGPVTITGITIGGNLQVQQLAPSTSINRICAALVSGNLQWQNNAAPVTIGGPFGPFCPGNSVGGNLQVQGNTMPSGYADPAATIDNNTIKNNLQNQNNTPPAALSGNTVGGNTQTS